MQVLRGSDDLTLVEFLMTLGSSGGLCVSHSFPAHKLEQLVQAKCKCRTAALKMPAALLVC